jgi:hypothetical protein
MILWNATAKLFTASLRQPSKEPFRSPMNNYWMTNKAMEPTTGRRTPKFSMTFNLTSRCHARSRQWWLILFSLIWLWICQAGKMVLCLHLESWKRKRV